MNRLGQVKKIVASQTLHGSGTLRSLLLYLAQHSTQPDSQGIKEYQIATEALGRSPDFDPRIDSTVRVTVARLRSKLEEYYTKEGRHDSVIVEIPKGSYRAVFRDRHRSGGSTERAKNGQEKRMSPWADAIVPAADVRTRPILAVLVIAVTMILGGIVGYRLSSATDRAPAEKATFEPAPLALQRFWGGFIAAPEKPIVVYSNARFVGRAHGTGLRYFDPAINTGHDVVDTYTGVGEVIAVHALGRTFWQLGREIEVKRGGLLGWDEAKNASLIFVGGPFENIPVRELRKLRDESEFVFEPSADPTGDYGSVVVNRRPRPGEQAAYDASENEGRHDYAVIRMTQGFAPGRRILVLAGVTTQGTEGAVEFVCRPGKAEGLLSRLQTSPDKFVGDFECILEIDLHGGLPVDSRIVALRNHANRAVKHM